MRRRLSQVFSLLPKEKLGKDIAYTMASFFVLAISGVMINVIITLVRNPQALGVFNLSYAVYIVVAQFASLGVQYSVLRFAAFYQDEPRICSRMFYTACLIVILLGVSLVCLMFQLQHFFAGLFHSDKTAQAIVIAAIGLLLFPLNKVLLAYLNGLKHMKAFSIVQASRYLVFMLVVLIIANSSRGTAELCWCFVIAEAVTTVIASVYILLNKLAPDYGISMEWIKKHLVFGIKGTLAGLFAEVNSRLDVLLLGFFMSSHDVGIYSFAAMLVDGLYHILAMVRINFNPLLVNIIKSGNWEQALALRSKAKKFLLPIMVVCSVILLTVFYIYTRYFVNDSSLSQGLLSLIILLVGLISVSSLIPFDNLMLASGHPGYQTCQQIIMVGFNLTIAGLLIPVIGIVGAAVGTALGFIAGIYALSFFAKRLVGWDLISNRYQVKVI